MTEPSPLTPTVPEWLLGLIVSGHRADRLGAALGIVILIGIVVVIHFAVIRRLK